MKLAKEDINQFIESRRSDDYRETCGYLLNPFKRWLGDRDLTEAEVKEYMNQKDWEPSSHNTFLAVLMSFAGWKMKRLPQDDLETYYRDRQVLEVIQDIERERVTKRVEKKGLTVKELEEILREFPVESLEFSIIWLLHYFGVRPGELVALRPGMASFEEGELVVETEKTKVERELYFDEFTAAHLKRFLDAAPSYMKVYRVCKAVEIKPKSGRQTFITHQMRQISRAGWDPVRGDILVKTASGHTTDDISAVYADLKTDMEKMFKDHHYMSKIKENFEV